MPTKATIEKARKDKREGKSASTQAGEFVHAEIDKIRRGEHGARSAKQAIAIGLSEAREEGAKAPSRKKSSSPRKKASSSRKKASSRTASTGGRKKSSNPSKRSSRRGKKSSSRRRRA